MSKKKFCEVVDQVCGILGVKDSESMHEACNIEVNGIAFTLTHGGDDDEDNLFAYCDFGELPTNLQLRELVLQRLLETNLVTHSDNTPSFGINPETGRVTFVLPAPLSKLGPGSLMGILVNMADYVDDWRETYFLTDDERARNAASPAPAQLAA